MISNFCLHFNCFATDAGIYVTVLKKIVSLKSLDFGVQQLLTSIAIAGIREISILLSAPRNCCIGSFGISFNKTHDVFEIKCKGKYLLLYVNGSIDVFRINTMKSSHSVVKISIEQFHGRLVRDSISLYGNLVGAYYFH